MTHFIQTTDRNKMPSDPLTATAFDSALAAVNAKYPLGIALTRGELLRLAQACLRLVELEGGK